MSEECGEVKEGHPPFFYWMRKELIDVFPFEKYKAINLQHQFYLEPLISDLQHVNGSKALVRNYKDMAEIELRNGNEGENELPYGFHFEKQVRWNVG